MDQIKKKEDDFVLRVGTKTYRKKEAVENRIRVARLRAEGRTLKEIALAYDVSEPRVCKLAKEGLEIIQELDTTKSEKRLLNSMRLESLINHHMKKALNKQALGTKDSEIALKAIKQQIDLEGITPPVKSVSVSTTIDDLMKTIGG